MHITVLQENLKKALSFVSKSISTKTQLPILGNILLKADTGKLTLSATNLETSISYWIGGTAEKAGSITVPARLFSEIIASFSHDKVELIGEKAILKLISGNSEATLNGIDAAEFPPFPEILKTKETQIELKQLEKGLPFVLISASNDEGRPLLTGVRLVKKGDVTVMVATDGYRLSVKELPLLSGLSEGVVISAKAFAEVYRIASEEQAENIDLFFSKDKNQLIFMLPSAQIATRLIEGDYPVYEKIIPSSFATKCVFSKEDIIKAVKLGSVYAKESANILRFKFAEKSLTVSANTPQVGENKTVIEAQIDGEEGEIAFNARFLLDLLNVFPEDQVVFEMNGSLSPGVFKTAKDASFLHIIMPVRVQG